MSCWQFCYIKSWLSVLLQPNQAGRMVTVITRDASGSLIGQTIYWILMIRFDHFLYNLLFFFISAACARHFTSGPQVATVVVHCFGCYKLKVITYTCIQQYITVWICTGPPPSLPPDVSTPSEPPGDYSRALLSSPLNHFTMTTQSLSESLSTSHPIYKHISTH